MVWHPVNLFAAIGVGLISMPVQALASETSSITTASEASFREWCTQLYEVPYADRTIEFDRDTIDTITALMAEVDTSDCQQAEIRLLEITDLRLYAPPAMEMPLTCLLIDLPTAIDLRPIVAAMPNLKQLDLSGRVIQNWTPISELSQLEVLNLENTQLQSLTPLANLTQLKRLEIGHNQVSSLAPLVDLPWLEHLGFRDNLISDLSPLATMPNLYSLRLGENPINSATCSLRWADACEGEI